MNAQFQYGFSGNIFKVTKEYKAKNKISSDEVANRLAKRDIRILNIDQTTYIRTKNKIIMDYVAEYVESKEMKEKLVAPLNHMHLFK